MGRGTTKRLQLLEESLKKKQQHFDTKLQQHFDTVPTDVLLGGKKHLDIS